MSRHLAHIRNYSTKLGRILRVPLSFVQNSVLNTLLLFVTILFQSCGGSSSSGPTSSTSGSVKPFLGVEKVFPNDDGTWDVWWPPIIGVSNVRYDVYQRYANEEFDFTKPVASTRENTHRTDDLRLIGNTCFVVRFTQPESKIDENTREICTNHQAYKFQGIESLVSLRDGSYNLKWAAPPFKGAQFQIFTKDQATNTWKSLAISQDNFYRTRKIALDEVVCFRVRYNIAGFPEDTNDKELCTTSIQQAAFAGIQALSSPSEGQLEVTWEASDNENVKGYNIYLGNDFKQKITSVAGRENKSHIITNLLHGVVYTVGVRAFDAYGREDQNRAVISYELANHRPLVANVSWEVLESNQFGRPVKVKCTASYTDDDDWQKLTPTFNFKNRKRNNLGIIERSQVEGTVGQLSSIYTLVNEDQRADEMICEVKVSDTFTDSLPLQSNPLAVSDTPVIATGMLLQARENTEIDIVITRGVGLGYTDFDNDDATEIIYSSTHGTMTSSPAFTCIDGTCTGRFKPDKDFFTDTDSANPQYALISYQVRAGDSVSNSAMANIIVKPVPRALGFDLIAKQDEDRFGEVGKTTILDANNEVITFAGYTHVLGHNPTMIYIRQPLSEADYKGQVKLPNTVTPDPVNGIGCQNVNVNGWATQGFECGIPCSSGKCPFVFRANNGYYGPAAFDYAVVIDGILSNYATARINVLPFLQATGYNALTIEGRSFDIKMFEGKGFQGSGNGIEVTNIIASNLVGTNQSLTFAKNANNEWVATFIPDTNFKGYATFDYILSAINQGTGLVIQSNPGHGKIHFYPKPIATNIALQSLENTNKLVPIEMAVTSTAKDGYYQEYLDPAKEFEIFNIQLARGYAVEIGAGVTNGAKLCTSGHCSFTFSPVSNYYDTNSSTYLKFNYRVKTQINPDLFSTPNLVIDPYLDTPANRTLVSNDGIGNIDIHPVPKVNPLDLVVAESLPGTPTALSINISNVGSPAAYTHVLGYLANSASIIDPPSQGSIGTFSCPGGGTCTSTYIPAVNQIGQLTPALSYKVTVLDPTYLLNGGLIDSLPGSINIDVRPMPKPQNLSFAVAENTTFAASNKTLSIDKNAGYTHALNYLATSAIVAEAGTANGALGTVSCTSGLCSGTYTPNVDYYGVTNFNFNVMVIDPKLGNLTSPNGVIALDVRPRPRVNNLGNLVAPQRVNENTAKTFQLSLGTEYSHPYGTKASGITILTASHYSAFPTGACNASGVCTVTFNPELNYEGSADFTYKVTINDTVLNQTLDSNIGTAYIDVYPAPRATGKQAFVVQNSTTPVTIQLRTGNLLNEDAFAIADHKGYAHRRDDKATNITVSNLTRGSLDPFTCDAAGLCTSSYQALDFIPAFDDGFDYKVTVGGLESNVGHFTLKILPSAVAINLSKVTVESTALDVMVLKGTGIGYTHPQDENASRIEIMGNAHGTAVIADLNTGDATKNCDATGSCKVTFTPVTGYSTPDNNLQEAYFQYRVWTYNAEFGGEIPSNTATVYINVRPKPKAQNLTVTGRQGSVGSVLFTSGSAYTYNAGNGRVDKIAIIPATAQNGTVDQSEYLCDSVGSCGPAAFSPGTMGDGSPYYGNGAMFQFKAVIFDTYLNAFIESDAATVTLDYRPVPVATSKHFVLWQGRNSALQFSPGSGYSHPYYASNPNQYKAVRMIIVTPPTHGTLTGNPGEFACDPGTHACAETFTPTSTYYYDGSSGFLTFSYKVVVNDPIYGDIESNVAQSTIEVRAVPVNIGKSVKGVQNVDKPLTLAPGNGFTYPTVMPSVPVITISNPVNGNLVNPFSCDINGCSAFFRTSNSGITGLTSFQYKITFNDPVLGPYDSEVKTYEIDFYPIPTATAFVHPVSSFTGYENQDFTVKFLPGNSDTNALCDAASQPLAPKLSYTHKLCTPAVETIILPGSQVNGSFVEGLSLSCSANGNCTGTFRPDAAAGTWQGYGIAQFDYRVRINPTALQGEILSPIEIAALTSNAATAQVEFKPIPWATGITLQALNPATDFIYAVQNYSQTLTLDRCNTPTPKDQCHKGYVHGYDENASTVHNFNLSNLTLNPWTCIAGICTTQLRPITDYYSPGVNDFATFDYDVSVGAQTSNRATVKVKVYPIPVAQTKASFGLENDDLILTVTANDGYTHPLNANATKIDIVVPPDEAKGNLVNPSNPTQVLKASLGNDLGTAFTCSSGTCTAIYRPEPNTGGLNSF